MASILQVNGKWRALIRRKGFKAKCRTFQTKAEADRWARRTEAEMDSADVKPDLGTVTVRDVIKAYRKMREEARPISDSANEHYMLKALEKGLGDHRLATIKPDDLIAYATMRREEGAGPYTINMDISKLGTALRYGGAALRIAPPDVVGAARPLLTHLRLIGGGGKRERRPTDDELLRLLAHLADKRGRKYADAARFAAITAMRRGEVCAILKADLDPAAKTVPVWRKHPRKGKVLERVPLLGEAWNIAMRQPDSEDGRLFPMDPTTLSKYFTWACRDLGIADLHLHDLRHEGTSKLFEDGYTIEQVALVTGHKDWRNLKRYTNLRPEDLTRQPSPSRQGAPRRLGKTPSASPHQGTSSRGKSRR